MTDRSALGYVARPARAVVDPALRRWLAALFLLFALLAVNSVYLVSVTLLEYLSGASYQDYFYLSMFLGHLLLGLIVIVPFLWFAISHLRRAIRRSNRNAVRAGLGLFGMGLLVIVSGLLLTRFDFFEINDPVIRRAGYWLHVITPLLAVWLFVLHRLAGRALRWRNGVRWAGVAVLFAGVMLGWHGWSNEYGATAAPVAFEPTLLSTPGGERLAVEPFMTDEFCAECHADIADSWRHSAHRFSSFNNPFYSFSVQETRRVSLARDGSVQASRFCAGCHDIVPLVSGRFDHPEFDIERDVSAHAGLTCTSCHAITAVNSVRGNADFTLDTPVQYPFEASGNGLLRGVAKQLIKAKPAYHKTGFLKPVHASSEFCATCHKAHMPVMVNQYKWLRGQNHYDSFNQSGVSGHRVDSFYYPPKAIGKCAACHMPLLASDDPAARDFDGSGERKVHSHFFPAANTGLAHTLGMPEEVIGAHRKMLEGAVRVDLFGIREAGLVDGQLHAPLGESTPTLEPGKRYLLEAVVRNLRVGHHLTQGTADSNELWLDVEVKLGDRVIGRSGAMADNGEVDPWSFFLNAYVLTRDGERLDRRNGQDTFVTLYNHQIPPGAAAVVHYSLEIPATEEGPLAGALSIEAAVRYRKFDTRYLAYVQGEAFERNELPITTLASDRLALNAGQIESGSAARPPAWERWNDYGIGLLLAGEAREGALRQAEAAFERVEELGRPDGPLNLARVYLKEGRIADAAAALQRAAEHDPGFRPWTRAWLTALVDRENGHLDQTIDTLEQLLATRFGEAVERGYDFSFDFRARNLLGRTLYERARMARGESRRAQRQQYLGRAREAFERVLELDPENLSAHFNLALVYAELGESERADRHRRLQLAYQPDEDAVARAVADHRRRNPAADHASEPVAIYDLQRPGAYGLPRQERVVDQPAGPSPRPKLTRRPGDSNEPRG